MHIPLINRLFFIHNPQFITKCRRTLALECISSALGVAYMKRHYIWAATVLEWRCCACQCPPVWVPREREFCPSLRNFHGWKTLNNGRDMNK